VLAASNISVMKFITITLMVERLSFSETSVTVYWTTWCYMPEDSHLYIKFMV
jgi:hypothetical protein